MVHSAQNNNQDFSSLQSKNAVNKDANGNTLATFYLGKREKNYRHGDKREAKDTKEEFENQDFKKKWYAVQDMKKSKNSQQEA